MQPYVIEELARQRQRELSAAAEQYALLGPRRRRRQPAAARTGRALVKICFVLPRGAGGAA